MTKNLLIILTVAISLASCQTPARVDYIVKASKIYTVDPSWKVDTYMAVKNGKIVRTGDSTLLKQYKADTLLDYSGYYIFPGFYDAHSHFYGYATGLLNADLTGTRSPQEVIARLKKHLQKHPGLKWLTGRGWDQNDWENKQYPTKQMLDTAFPDIPVALTRIDGHALWVNSKALELADINGQTKIQGGDILLGSDGQPTGILIDNAEELILKLIPSPTEKQTEQALLEAQNNCFSVGLTSVSDAGLPLDKLLLLDSLQKAGLLKIRIYAMMSADPITVGYFIKNGIITNERLTIRSIKLFADGALGSRGALLLEPYSDDPGNYGLLVTPIDTLKHYMQIAYDNGFQVNTHAIGDSANRLVLNLYAGFLKGKNDRRWRIEHAQVINPADFKKFGEYSIIPSVQPTHATSDMYWATDRLGPERIKGAYAYRTLLEQNGWIALGSDFPVEDINPMLGIYAAVSRQDLNRYPPEGFMKNQALTRKQAIRGFTIWAAKAAFEENYKGSLEPGKVADFAVLDRDLMTCNVYDIPKTRVIATFVDGQKVFDIHKTKTAASN